jgi:hypothetical protein
LTIVVVWGTLDRSSIISFPTFFHAVRWVAWFPSSLYPCCTWAVSIITAFVLEWVWLLKASLAMTWSETRQ